MQSISIRSPSTLFAFVFRKEWRVCHHLVWQFRFWKCAMYVYVCMYVPLAKALRSMRYVLIHPLHHLCIYLWSDDDTTFPDISILGHAWKASRQCKHFGKPLPSRTHGSILYIQVGILGCVLPKQPQNFAQISPSCSNDGTSWKTQQHEAKFSRHALGGMYVRDHMGWGSPERSVIIET